MQVLFKLNKALPYLLFIFLCSFIVIADTGTCQLGKYTYHNGEDMVLSCSCTTPLEKNEPGYFVWKNSTGQIMRSVATNSNDCETEIFGDTFSIPLGFIGTGNVTFSADANGNIPITDWNNVGDTPTDTFNVTSGNIYDCIITDIIGSEMILGEQGAFKIKVIDSITRNPLNHVSCQACGYNVDESPILFEPYNEGESFRYSTAEGEVGFQHTLTEDRFKTNTNYIAEFHCSCIPDSVLGIECYDDIDGSVQGYKSCSAQVIFRTGLIDNREKDITKDKYILYFGIGVCLILLLAGFWKEDATLISISGILSMALGVLIIINGFTGLNNILSKAIGIILIGLGAYLFIRSQMELIGE